MNLSFAFLSPQSLQPGMTLGQASLILLALVLLVLGGLAAKKIIKIPLTWTQREWKWLALLVLLVLPFNFFSVVVPFEGQITSSLGQTITPTAFLLGLVPLLAATGLIGLVPALFVATGTGVLQAAAFHQDPFIILYLLGFVLFFGIRQRRVLHRGALNSQNSPFSDALISLGFIAGVMLVARFSISLAYGLHDLNAILNQYLLQLFVVLPGGLIAALAVQALSCWMKAEWQPLTFLNPQPIANGLQVAVDQVETLTEGNFDKPLAAKPENEKELILFHALEQLRETLRQRSDAQNRLLSLDPANYTKEGNDLVLSAILRAALGREASSARLILTEQKADEATPLMRLRIGQGENTRVYAYLDVMILEKMAADEQLILSNLKEEQYFGLDTGTPIPQSIAALRLRQDGISRGILWVGFEQNHWFSEDDINFYQQLAYRASAVLSAKEKTLKLSTENEQLQDAIDAFPEPLMVFDANQHLIHANQAASSVLSKNEIIPQPGSENLQVPSAEIANLLRDKSKQPTSKMVSLAGGQDYEASTYPIMKGQQQQGSLLLLRDTGWLKRLNAQKNEFVTNISHDLRSPLVLMKGYAKLLQNIGNLSEEQIKYVGRIESGIENMSRLVNKVLSLEQMDNSQALQYATFDTKELVEETLALLDLQAQQRRITLHTDFGGLKKAEMMADKVMLQQALYNLIENAIKFSPRGGAVLIKAENDNRWVHFSVQDHGKGIAPLDQPKLFTRFFHVDDDMNIENRGQGLGLSIVKSTAERHGGKVSVESKLGVGSTFYLDIPMKKY